MRKVHVVNLSQYEVWDSFEGIAYCFPPRTSAVVDAVVARHWFGDERLKDKDFRDAHGGAGGPEAWGKEQSRVRSRGCCEFIGERDQTKELHTTIHAQPTAQVRHLPDCVWKLKQDGELFVEEFGRGKAFYAPPKTQKQASVVGVPLSAGYIPPSEVGAAAAWANQLKTTGQGGQFQSYLQAAPLPANYKAPDDKPLPDWAENDTSFNDIGVSGAELAKMAGSADGILVNNAPARGANGRFTKQAA